jgi:hypothetical protein
MQINCRRNQTRLAGEAVIGSHKKEDCQLKLQHLKECKSASENIHKTIVFRLAEKNIRPLVVWRCDNEREQESCQKQILAKRVSRMHNPNADRADAWTARIFGGSVREVSAR